MLKDLKSLFARDDAYELVREAIRDAFLLVFMISAFVFLMLGLAGSNAVPV